MDWIWTIVNYRAILYIFVNFAINKYTATKLFNQCTFCHKRYLSTRINNENIQTTEILKCLVLEAPPPVWRSMLQENSQNDEDWGLNVYNILLRKTQDYVEILNIYLYMYDKDMMAWSHLFCFSPPAVSEVWRVWCIWQHWQHPHSVCASLSPFVSRYFHIHMIARHSPKWAFCKGQHLLNIPEYKTF